MSITSRSPLRMAGAVINSGSINTGEVNFTTGGGQSACIFSGMASGAFAAGVSSPLGAFLASGADGLIASGAGRLKSVLTHATYQSLSGVAIVFYDAPVASSGGPIPTSGHRIVGIVPAGFGVSGQITGQSLFQFDMPYHSGLCVATKSGQPGFTCSFLPETNLINPG